MVRYSTSIPQGTYRIHPRQDSAPRARPRSRPPPGTAGFCMPSTNHAHDRAKKDGRLNSANASYSSKDSFIKARGSPAGVKDVSLGRVSWATSPIVEY
nr:hypothetical protein CFP56_68164 [Quercus suber]